MAWQILAAWMMGKGWGLCPIPSIIRPSSGDVALSTCLCSANVIRLVNLPVDSVRGATGGPQP